MAARKIPRPKKAAKRAKGTKRVAKIGGKKKAAKKVKAKSWAATHQHSFWIPLHNPRVYVVTDHGSRVLYSHRADPASARVITSALGIGRTKFAKAKAKVAKSGFKLAYKR